LAARKKQKVRKEAIATAQKERRRLLVEAARSCFLQFGFAKTSLDDIAKRANISRPLIYRSFKNKEDIFAAVFEFTFEERWPAAEKAAKARGVPKKEKLFRIYELLLLEPWDEISGGPMLDEYYEACERLIPKAEEKHARLQLKYTQTVLGDRELSELFMLAADGLTIDLPSTGTLRRRLELLVERFVS
jgi:TetR/AcrR family transcriptional regulator, transcriptional repressor of aconitase